MLLYAADTHSHFPQSRFCCVLHGGCEIPELFVFLPSMNIVLATLAYHHCTRKCWNTVAGLADGEANWKNQQNMYRVSGVDIRQQAGACLGYPFSLGGVKRRVFPPNRNFLAEQPVSSLFRKSVDSFESVFIF